MRAVDVDGDLSDDVDVDDDGNDKVIHQHDLHYSEGKNLWNPMERHEKCFVSKDIFGAKLAKQIKLTSCSLETLWSSIKAIQAGNVEQLRSISAVQ